MSSSHDSLSTAEILGYSANSIGYLFQFCNTVQSARINYFFCRYDDETSLRATTILSSLIRQCLDVENLPTTVESRLAEYLKDPPLNALQLESLLQDVIALSEVHFVVIDGVDECRANERKTLFKVLHRLLERSGSTLKLLLISRDSISTEVKMLHRHFHHVQMSRPEASSDIEAFIKDEIQERVASKELVVGNSKLLKDIQDALVRGAQGMFLWVVFMIQDLCSQSCDEDIRRTIDNLPEDLPKLYHCIVSRIVDSKHEKTVKKILRMLASVQRPLSIGELQEALSVEPYSSYLKPGRRTNDIWRDISWCENLVYVDEGDDTVHFAHYTIKIFLLDQSLGSHHSDFHFHPDKANYELGEICVTYLNSSDFKRQLDRITKAQASFSPELALEASLSAELGSKLGAPLSKLGRLQCLRKTTNFDLRKQIPKSAETSIEHPFLDYASKYWLQHCTDFTTEDIRAWNLWKAILLNVDSLGHTSWTGVEWNQRAKIVLDFILSYDHKALLTCIEKSNEPFHKQTTLELFISAAGRGKVKVLEYLLETDPKVAVESLRGRTALHAAAEGGHIEIVERLLATEADINKGHGQNALEAAAGGGHIEVVERLLAAEADVDVLSGRTALQAAAHGGHIKVVERLLTAKADVNAPAAAADDRTALQSAAHGGHIKVVKRLLAAEADVNAAAASVDGRTALQAAAEGGHSQVKKLLKDHRRVI
ncbi:hypothetical protein EPUS_06398 [Endocarpon pusillum Z07020]|uniref:Uncharacterized protein n=1 Tax=Endocarpon pusillum (strain Z07020 / HMAS-L-300199) TaxID=1263415 RepID=U1HXI1_ENDPU|nr:uncharacterized protein EPUS_06398 [Endocarpon pusillum Z07020]ERF74129.1 hypothetical protein EPUS_06398 [Endocarpon pusillum Z07020]